MKYIKKFESFDFNQTLPVTTENFITNYYKCNDCNALWENKNKVSNLCKFCDSDSINDIGEKEFYKLVGARLDDDEKEDMNKERVNKSKKAVNLFNIKRERYVN